MVSTKQLAFHAINQGQRIRRFVPIDAVPERVARRIDKAWQDPAYRAAQEAQMHHLLRATPRAHEADDLARGYAEYSLLRTYLRWNPPEIRQQEIRGLEHLTSERDASRGVVLSFTHHAMWTGLFSALSLAGVKLEAVLAPIGLRLEEPIIFRQHRRVASRHVGVIDSTRGVEEIVARLTPGSVVAIAPDVPGQTEVTWLGQRLRGSFGTPRIATMTGSPVVVITSHQQEGWRPYLQLHPPLEPTDFATPHDLLGAILELHGRAVLAWPEAFEMPLSRFAPLDVGSGADPS